MKSMVIVDRFDEHNSFSQNKGRDKQLKDTPKAENEALVRWENLSTVTENLMK
jgi:hypothetical protein